MSCKILALPLLALALQAQIKAPQIGAIRCADGAVRPVYGVPGAFVLGKPFLASATAVSFSENGGIVVTASAVLLLDSAGKAIGEWAESGPGTTVGIDSDPSSAVAWLPKYSLFLTWDGQIFHQTAVSSPASGHVVAVRRDSDQAYLTAADAAGAVSEYAFSLSSGELTSVRYLAGVTGAVLPFGASELFVDTAGIALQTAAGTQTFPFSAPGLGMERMGNGWVHVTSANSTRNWAVHVSGAELQIYELPAIIRPLESR